PHPGRGSLPTSLEVDDTHETITDVSRIRADSVPIRPQPVLAAAPAAPAGRKPLLHSSYPESFERQLGDRVTKRLKSPRVHRLPRVGKDGVGGHARQAETNPRRTNRRARRRMGRAAPGPPAERGAVSRGALRGSPERCAGR